MEEITVPDGLYGEKQVQQVRVLTPGAFEIHQKDKKGDFVLVDEGSTSLSEIPFAVAYSNRVGVLESRPPLADIAELNLKAFQVQSDLDNQLHISAVPMLAIYGFPQSAECEKYLLNFFKSYRCHHGPHFLSKTERCL